MQAVRVELCFMIWITICLFFEVIVQTINAALVEGAVFLI